MLEGTIQARLIAHAARAWEHWWIGCGCAKIRRGQSQVNEASHFRTVPLRLLLPQRPDPKNSHCCFLYSSVTPRVWNLVTTCLKFVGIPIPRLENWQGVATSFSSVVTFASSSVHLSPLSRLDSDTGDRGWNVKAQSPGSQVFSLAVQVRESDDFQSLVAQAWQITNLSTLSWTCC